MRAFLLTRVHFRSRDKDGCYTIRRSTVAENPMPHANITAPIFDRTVGVIADRSYTLRAGIFDLFGSCDLDLDPMSFIYEFEPYPLRYAACANMNFLCQGFLKLFV